VTNTLDESNRQPAQWYECSGFQRDLLLGIAAHDHLNERPYGVALQEWLDARYPTTVVRSRVYHNLGELVDMGLIEPMQSPDRKTGYRLTNAGKASLAAHSRFVNALDLSELLPARDGA